MGVQWSQNLAVGVMEIDGQHKELFNRINALLDALGQGKGKQELGNTLKFLEDYTKTHFAAEEKLMTKHSYPAYAVQKAEHTKFINELNAMHKEFDGAGASLPLLIQVQKKTVDWLMNHISKMDKELGKFLNESK